ncbi:TetR/AcrR family transcriptional regulator [Mycobacterium sp. 852002-51057_SCH5723018]|uniref:TetR/AcrR family transcriptional regulator n=1 Tax=Mycobacterium sp. 852002-51057_SCH5723018 TaxID=1834094 RepID=UPI0007FBF27E|nr:TetR/AcrR family transcriptional regulator [Mycobacterium sp. 852002-51057_SCH5723018]OBG26717.1 TetR family transcriptional regulator [Mycobacterium sp. 852002-51057_SCH5723018]
MGAPLITPHAPSVAGGVREVRRLETRARLFDAALGEIGRSGLAGADVSAIASAAGVVRGTFYFHFPTKEHVLVELERNEEATIVSELADAQTDSDDLVSLLSLLVEGVVAAERRLGPVVFREMLGLHFSATRPVEDELTEHPLADFVIAAITRAQDAGRIPPDQDASELAVFFLTGLFALLATGVHDSAAADAVLSRYVTTIVKGMESR